ncbi:MAG: hypothetical protein Q9225_007838, partial [Loekoesia sp. 1 TL-2023]
MGICQVLEDLIARRRQGKGVVLSARSSAEYIRPGAPVTLGRQQIYWIMQDLIRQDIVIVTCAGDGPRRPSRPGDRQVRKATAVWSNQAFPIVVAGAVTNTGGYAEFSWGDNMPTYMAWAPGDGVVCASNRISLLQKGRGTAFAAGMVAGFAAYLLNNSTFPQRPGFVADDIRGNLSNRKSRPVIPQYQPKVIWNFQDGSRDPNTNAQDILAGLAVPPSNSSQSVTEQR